MEGSLKDGSSQKCDIQIPFVESTTNEVQPYNPATATVKGKFVRG